jgi:hypothetical protein
MLAGGAQDAATATAQAAEPAAKMHRTVLQLKEILARKHAQVRAALWP